jgi:predicted phosphohydrolase
LIDTAEKKIRIVVVSDTHSRHRRIVVPEGDLLIHAGDATMAGTAAELIEFNAWLGTLPHGVKLVCAGNHDWLFEKDPGMARMIMTNARYVEDRLVTVFGLRIYLSPWQPRFFDWAFNLDRGEPIRAKWDLIPGELDILVTHGPPYGILDVSGLTGEHAGCEELRRAVRRVRPRVHIFGHIHDSYGVAVDDGIKFVNASICDESYLPIREPIVIDWDRSEREREGA